MARRAVVAFSDTIEEDAARRDFTMNAIYARPDGTVLDPLGGLPDLQARRVRFIGTASPTASARITCARCGTFRFHAWYGDADAGFDPDALAAIASQSGRAWQALSRERVGAELLKLLGAPDPAPSVAAMRSTGVLARVLPALDDRALAPLVATEQAAGAAPDPVRRLAAIATPEDAATLRLSKAQLQRLTRMRDEASTEPQRGRTGLSLWRRRRAARNPAALRFLGAAVWSEDLRTGAAHRRGGRFPIKASDLIPDFTGPALGKKLAELGGQVGSTSGFTLTREELLDG